MTKVDCNDWPEPTWPSYFDDDEEKEEYLQEQEDDAMNRGHCEATDGCMVESDGTCEHGHPSWLLREGWI